MTKVISLIDRIDAKKRTEEGRIPLHVSHLDGKVNGSPWFKRPPQEDFGKRMERIKTSIEKINEIMTELKKSSREKNNV